MNNKYTDEEKQIIIERYLSGKAIGEISVDTEIPRSTIYAWVKQYQEDLEKDKKAITSQGYLILENKVKRLEGIIKILKTVECTANDPLKVKLSELESLYGQYSVHMLCEALDGPRGTFYNHILRNKKDHTWCSKRREEFRIKIQQIYDDSNQILGATSDQRLSKERRIKFKSPYTSSQKRKPVLSDEFFL